MRKIKDNLSSVLVIAVVFVIAIVSLILEDNSRSVLENRNLQIMPTAENLIIENKYTEEMYKEDFSSGEIFKKWDTYFTDHIALRNIMVNSYLEIQGLLNREHINKVFIGDDGYFLSNSNIRHFSEDEMKERANHFNNMANTYSNSKMYLVNLPSKSEVYEDKMPLKGYEFISNEFFTIMESYIDKDKITVTDMYDIFTSDEDLYYKTDHHWNMNGTFIAYENIINEFSKNFPEIGEPKEKDYFDLEVYEDYFVGSDGRKALQLVDELDTIELYRHKNEEDYKVTINGEEGKFFYTEQLSEDKLNDDYLVYFNNNNPEVIIENTVSDNDLKIVIIGDSMDNQLAPLLATHFSEVYSYELRHYKEDINARINSINPDIVLCIGLTNYIIDKDGGAF